MKKIYFSTLTRDEMITFCRVVNGKLNDLAEMFNVSYQHMYAILKRNNIRIKDYKPKKARLKKTSLKKIRNDIKFSKLDKESMIRACILFNGNGSKIAKLYNITRQNVNVYLLKNNINIKEYKPLIIKPDKPDKPIQTPKILKNCQNRNLYHKLYKQKNREKIYSRQTEIYRQKRDELKRLKEENELLKIKLEKLKV